MERCNFADFMSASAVANICQTKPSFCFLQVDMRRANNCEIMLTKVKVPLPEVIVSCLKAVSCTSVNRVSKYASFMLQFLVSSLVDRHADISFFVCV